MDGAWRHNVLGGFERELAFLGHSDEHDAFSGPKATAIACSNVVFALGTFELNEWHHLLLGKCTGGLHEPIVKWTKGSRRGDPVADVVAQEGTQLPGRLEFRHVAVEVQTVNARGGHR